MADIDGEVFSPLSYFFQSNPPDQEEILDFMMDTGIPVYLSDVPSSSSARQFYGGASLRAYVKLTLRKFSKRNGSLFLPELPSGPRNGIVVESFEDGEAYFYDRKIGDAYRIDALYQYGNGVHRTPVIIESSFRRDEFTKDAGFAAPLEIKRALVRNVLGRRAYTLKVRPVVEDEELGLYRGTGPHRRIIIPMPYLWGVAESLGELYAGKFAA